jgi:hypothetical protein
MICLSIISPTSKYITSYFELIKIVNLGLQQFRITSIFRWRWPLISFYFSLDHQIHGCYIFACCFKFHSTSFPLSSRWHQFSVKLTNRTALKADRCRWRWLLICQGTKIHKLTLFILFWYNIDVFPKYRIFF